MSYIPPLRDIEFALNELADLQGVAEMPGHEQATPDLVHAVLEEAGKLATEVLAPLNVVGDREQSRLENGSVKTPEGWREAYRHFTQGGWNGLALDPEYGGQGLPWLVATAVQEMLHSANMSFGLCPLLTQAAVEAISRHGTPQQKALYLQALTTGRWTGTMNLTEPQAGSDLGAVRAKAVPEGDHYLISGQKIFITYGDHDLTENIVHLVLARTPDAPPGVKGISMFIVPKMKLGRAGDLQQANDVRCVSLEHKLGIHASPTAVLAYGDSGGAVGYLIGEENRGLEYMFTMMNLARLGVGVEGVGVGERAYQQARAYALERVQGHAVGAPEGERATIVRHPDVRRMLMTMKAQVEAMRALCYVATTAYDKALRHPDAEARRHNQELVDLLTPVVKGWCTETGVEVASTGLQVHGGMGYIEETGAAQYLRDARITTIYEGTTGIQANDLIGRKLIRNNGVTAKELIAQMRAFAQTLAGSDGDAMQAVHAGLSAGIEALEQATLWVLTAHRQDPRLPLAASVPYLRLFGVVAGGWQLARGAAIARRRLTQGERDSFLEAKLLTARFYAEHIMPQAGALLHTITRGSEAVLALEDDQF